MNLVFDFVRGTAEEVYPCWCGETHRGEFGVYDYGHHNCPHGSPLSVVVPGQLICNDCGKTFAVEA